MTVTTTRRFGMGVRTDTPTQPRAPKGAHGAPKPKTSAMSKTYEAAASKNKLVDVSPSKAKALEAKFNSGSVKTENLSAGRVGASIQGMVVDGELFVRTRAVVPNAKPRWASAGALKDAPKPTVENTTKPGGGWGPKPKSLEARVQKVVAERMGLLSNPTFALTGAELTQVKKGIANGDFEVVSASPKGLTGVGYTGYVADGMLVVEKKAVAPGAKPTFYLLGPID